MRINLPQILIIVFFLSNEANAQRIYLIKPNGEPINCESPFHALINFDNDTTIEQIIDDEILFVDSNNCSRFVDIIIKPNWGQTFHNQYLKSQLRSLDTIVINQTRIIKSQTPRLLFGIEKNIDSIIHDQLWFRDWLKNSEGSIQSISFWVYNADRLKGLNKKFAKELIKRYCKQINYSNFKTKIEFLNEPYTSGQEDHFNEGTVMDRDFIDNQNTPFMKQLAEEYNLVVTVVINWKRN